MKAAPSLGFHYRSSRWLLVAMLIMAPLALLAVWISGAPVWLQVLLTACVVVWAGMGMGKLLHPRVRSVTWRVDGGVELVLDGGASAGREVQGAVAAVRMVGPLIALTLRWPPRECATLWLLPDNLDADTRRRLRMRLGSAATGDLLSGNADSS